MNISREPVITTAIVVAVVMAVVEWLRVMGYLGWDESQVSATENLVATFAPILILFGGAWWTRSRVTPLLSAQDEDKEPLTRPDNSPPLAQQRATVGKVKET